MKFALIKIFFLMCNITIACNNKTWIINYFDHVKNTPYKVTVQKYLFFNVKLKKKFRCVTIESNWNYKKML